MGPAFAEEVKAARADTSVGIAASAGRSPVDCIMDERRARESSAADAGSASERMELDEAEGLGAAALSFETALLKASMAAVAVMVESLKEDLSACWIKVAGVIVV